MEYPNNISNFNLLTNTYDSKLSFCSFSNRFSRSGHNSSDSRRAGRGYFRINSGSFSLSTSLSTTFSPNVYYIRLETLMITVYKPWKNCSTPYIYAHVKSHRRRELILLKSGLFRTCHH